jgi:hypothetical protein
MAGLKASLELDGFACVPSAVPDALCNALNESFSATGEAGSRRLLHEPLVVRLVQHLRTASPVAGLLPVNPVAVQCSLFSKSQASNWLVPPHQDLSIPVAERVLCTACSGWAEKEGLLFVQPPVELLAQLLAVRVTLDAPSANSGELHIAPGTHLLGRIPATSVGSIAPLSAMQACQVPRGGALVMRPLTVHASRKAGAGTVRRVLHILFGPPRLSYGLRWGHIV